MGHLDKLNVSRRVILAAKPRRSTDTIDYRRNKLIANVEEQIELVKLALEDEPMVLNRKRGASVVTVKPRIWWTVENSGKVFTQIRYNKIPLNIAGKGTTIEAGTLRKLLSVYRTVVKAVKAGELDRPIQNASKKSRP